MQETSLALVDKRGFFRGAGYGNRFAFSFLSARKENIGSHQCLHWLQQMSTGHLHLDGFDSFSSANNKSTSNEVLLLLEQGTCMAWKLP